MTDILDAARRVLTIEAEAVASLVDSLDSGFENAVEMILACKGKVVITGIGKSGLICQKIASTMASTGTPAFFLHPAEGIHGDLGMLMKGDAVIAISYSGETAEVTRILPVIKRMGLPLLSICSKAESTLVRAADTSIIIPVKEEACPLGLAPTASTTATLAMGDALAVALLTRRGFNAENFAFFHPGGSLGKRLIALVQDFMHRDQDIPLVKTTTPLKEALFVITDKKLGVTGVVDDAGALVGVFTDGDLRRALEKGLDVLNRPVVGAMTCKPKRILKSDLAAKALHTMEKYSITSLFVFESETSEAPVGIIHIHDLIKAGIV